MARTKRKSFQKGQRVYYLYSDGRGVVMTPERTGTVLGMGGFSYPEVWVRWDGAKEPTLHNAAHVHAMEVSRV